MLLDTLTAAREQKAHRRLEKAFHDVVNSNIKIFQIIFTFLSRQVLHLYPDKGPTVNYTDINTI